MQKFYSALCIVFIVLFSGIAAKAQLTGTKTIPGDYTTISAAITDLNAQSVGAGGVTFNVAAGHTETLAGKLILTATGTSANHIVFQKSGAGANPVITAYTGAVTPGSSTGDGFWVLAGSDYVTIDGIDLQENAANTTATMLMEFGYAMFKASATDGCQFNTIKNCAITLNRLSFALWTTATSNGATGIAIGNNLYTATPLVTVTAASGSNSFNKIYANTIQNCQTGIAIWGFAATGGSPNPDPSTFLGDIGNDVGGNSAATGNTILNYGGGASVNRPAIAVNGNTQWSFNCSYNTINNNNGAGVNHPNILRAILIDGNVSGQSTNCTNNNITLHAAATGANGVLFIENSAGTFAGVNAGGILNISNNTISGDCNTANGNGVLTTILSSGQFTTININDNTIDGITHGADGLANTGALTAISHTVAAGTVNVRNNTIKNIRQSGTGGVGNGDVIGINVIVGTTQTIQSNTIEAITVSGNSGASYAVYGIRIGGGTSLVDNNTIRNFTSTKTTSTSPLTGISQIIASTADVFSNNKIYNFTNGGTGAAGAFGITWATNTAPKTVSGNEIHGFSTAGTGTVTGILHGSATPANIFKNKIYDFSSTTTNTVTSFIISGMFISNLASTGTNIYNNYIGDLRAPEAGASTAIAPVIRGINIAAINPSSSINLYYNTIYLNTSSASGANYGTAGLYVNINTTATTAALTLRNNIIINKSAPSGNGNTVAYQRTGPELDNFIAADNNLFYAGTPATKRLIFYDIDHSDQTLAAYKARVSPRDANSVTEDVPFLSTVGSSATFLHIDPNATTLVRDAGTPVGGITDDYDGDVRNASTPDIGADEFVTCTTVVAGTASGSTTFCGSGTPTITATGYSTGDGVIYQWMSSANSADYPASGTPVATQTNPAALTTGLVNSTTYYWLRLTCASGPATDNSNMITVTVNPLPSLSGALTQPLTCVSPDGAINLTVSGTPGPYTYNWSTSNGIGLVNGVEDQSNLTVGSYTVVVTDQSTTCQATTTFTLGGPGGCEICPAIGSLTTNPGTNGCNGSPVTLTASGLVGMGTTYGVQFKYSTIALADPYTGGTVIATVPNGSLTAGGTTATTTTTLPASGNYFIYAILSPTPLDLSCRPSAQAAFEVNDLPTVNAVSNQSLCNGANTTAVTFSGTPAGVTFSWTNNTPSIGLAASGNGNIASFTATNATASPITATITVTPLFTYGAATCTGTPITFTITVNPPPVITCPSSIVVNATAGQCGAVVNYPPATATGSPAPTITYSHASGSMFPVGVTTVTATATNSCGTSTCNTFTITVNDTQAPAIVCPADITVTNNANQCGAVVNYNLPVVTDNCQKLQAPATILPHGAGAITFAGNTTPGGFYFDITNNSAFTQTIGSLQVRFGATVIGGAVPSPAPVSVYVTTSATTFTGNQTTASAWTAIGTNIPVTVAGANSEFSLVQLPGSGITLAPGASRGMYVFGNVSSLVYNNAANSSLTPITNGVLTLTPGQASGGLFTNVGATPRTPNVVLNYYRITQTAGLPSGSLFPIGTTTNTFIATDDAGNTSTCSFAVTVNDTQAPTVACPVNVTRATDAGVCTATFAPNNPTAADNCGVTIQTWALTGATVATSPATGINTVGSRAFNVGVTTVTYTVKDAAGNTGSCSFNVTVTDAALPVISTQPANQTVCAGTTATFSVISSNALSYQWQQWNGTAWTNAAGASTASSYSIANVTRSMNTNTYRVIVTGLCSSAPSNAATLFVNALPTISLTSSNSPVLLPGQTTNIIANVNPTGGTFAWFKNGAPRVPTVTTGTLSNLSADDAGTYRTTYTDPNGCVATSSDIVISAEASGQFFVAPNPNFGQFWVRYYNQAGEALTVSVFDAKGRRVHQQQSAGTLPYTRIDVDMGVQAGGIYIVELRGAGGKLLGRKQIIVGQRF